MAVSKSVIRDWLNWTTKLGRKYTHVLIVCDGFSHNDYPIYCHTPQIALEEFADMSSRNMQRVIECYDLSMDIEAQLKEHRAMHLPEPITKGGELK